MTVTIEYRPVHLAFDAFHALDAQCFPDEPIREDAFASMVSSEFWVVWLEQRLVGYSHLKLSPQVAWIARVAVLDTERNRGIGSRLMDVMLSACRARPQDEVILYVMQDNASAIHLYEKCGFTVIEETWQYIVPTDEIQGASECLEGPVLRAVPLPDILPGARPAFEGQWLDLPERHDPPGTYVLGFESEEGPAGYCRLSPGFPGCFPFVLAIPATQLRPALGALAPYLLAEHRTLKLTITRPEEARACEAQGFDLNYRLYKMSRSRPA